MDQITLADDLVKISAEITIYKQQAGLAVFEIGRRLKLVKDNDLAHGQWESWLKSVDVVPQTARKMIQAFEQFSNSATSRELPTGKIFEMLSLPDSVNRDDFITTEHIIPETGESKTVDEMTVKELREVKKALQEAERVAAQAKATAETERNSSRHYEKLWNQAKNQPARTETRTVEVVPTDYQELKREAVKAQELNTEVVQLKRAQETIRQQYEEKLSNQQQQDYVKKDLQKYLSEHLRSMTMNHDSAVFNYTSIQGDREAHEIVMRFLTQYESIIKQQIKEWEQLTTIRAVN